MLSDDTSQRIRHWVTWRIVAELFRRHQPHSDLRLYELHPGGGQYDCLSLYVRGPGEPWPGDSLVHFTGFRRIDTLGTQRRAEAERTLLEERGGYVWPYLCADDPKGIIDEIETLIGLKSRPGQLPLETPTVHTVWLMADLLGVALQTRGSWQWRSAFYDSSGDGTGPRSEFLAVEHIAKRVDPESGPRGYQRYWMLVPGAHHGALNGGPAAVVDLAGRIWLGRNLENQERIPDLVKRLGDHPSAATWSWQRRRHAG